MSIDVKHLKKLKTLKPRMSEEQKRKLLIGLRKMREEYTGNPGGETDLRNSENPLTNENEFTGTGVASASGNSEPNVIAQTFETEADYDSYVNQRRGIEMTPKEQQAIGNFRDARPTQQDRFLVQYNQTDPFEKNSTITIKKLKDGGLFCWTAFSKYESAEDEGKPNGSENGSENGEKDKGDKETKGGEETEGGGKEKPDLKEQDPSQDEVTVGDKIRVVKSITFNNETDGADVLSNFIASLDI